MLTVSAAYAFVRNNRSSIGRLATMSNIILSLQVGE
jgi:hypothetical protein